MLTVLLLWAAFAAAIAAAWLILGFLTLTAAHLIGYAANRRRYRTARQRLYIWFLTCGCTVIEDAAGTHTLPCAACEAMADVEARTEQT